MGAGLARTRRHADGRATPQTASSGVGTTPTKDRRTVRRLNERQRNAFVCLAFDIRLLYEGITNVTFVRATYDDRDTAGTE